MLPNCELVKTDGTRGHNMEIKIIDNFISSVYENHLENLITDSILPLYYNKHTLENPPVHGKESPQFTHRFFMDNKVSSSYMSHIEPIILHLIAKTEILCLKNLVKCKLNFNYQDLSYAENEYYPVHTDNTEKGITAIYYINDSDGDTLFFDKDYKIIKSVTPKKGRIVCFDNQILHAGQPPKQSPYRAVINFNWI